MLFNSYVFIFVFLPCALAGFYGCCRLGRWAAAAWLVLASLIFYGWWNPQALVLLTASIVFNFGMAEAIVLLGTRPRLQTATFVFAIAANLLALAYYKYLSSVFVALTGLGLVHGTTPDIVLPLGISFFTFTQIGYLVDRKQGLARSRGPLDYVLFVTFFPHLIAGPILHNGEIMPQFADRKTYRFSRENLCVGSTIFVIGLTKKCLFADPLSICVRTGFADPGHLPFLAAWNTAICASLQIYFDFSGYSDMAIGLARMFNVRFPLNFNSPYKAASIIEHWQRWHMTLSRYLATYVYTPMALAISRQRTRRGAAINRTAQATLPGFASMVALPTLITMGLAGIWHGAGVQFLIFGLLHGIYLTINHATRLFGRGRDKDRVGLVAHGTSVLVTYLATMVAMVFFRAPTVSSAVDVLLGMAGLRGFGGVALPTTLVDHTGHLGARLAAHGLITGVSPVDFVGQATHVAWIVCLYGIVWGMPNTQQILCRFSPAIGPVHPGPIQRLTWRPDLAWGLATGVVACLGVLAIGGTSEFLYFQF